MKHWKRAAIFTPTSLLKLVSEARPVIKLWSSRIWKLYILYYFPVLFLIHFWKIYCDIMQSIKSILRHSVTWVSLWNKAYHHYPFLIFLVVINVYIYLDTNKRDLRLESSWLAAISNKILRFHSFWIFSQGLGIVWFFVFHIFSNYKLLLLLCKWRHFIYLFIYFVCWLG